MPNLTSFRTGKNSFTRVFIIEGRARPDHQPEYQASMVAGAPSWSFGDITKIEVPSPDQYGEFIEIGNIRGAKERVTLPLTGRFAADMLSRGLELARAGCAFDVQVVFGACTDPTNYNVFQSKLIFEDALITSYDIDDLGALSSDDTAPVNETVEVSSRDLYQLVQLSWAEKAASIITNEIIHGTVCGTPSCGDCDEESDGCTNWFFITTAAGGSPSTPADVVFSPDGGTTWYAHDIDTLGIAEVPDQVACFGDYLVVVSEDSNSLHYATLTDFDGVIDPAFTEVTTGFVVGGEPRCIWNTGRRLIIGGANGYVYATDDPTSGVTVLDAGIATSEDLNVVKSFGDDIIVLAGDNGVVLYTVNGESFGLTTNTPGAGTNHLALDVKNASEWAVGGTGDVLHYTLNAGNTWTNKAFNLSGSGGQVTSLSRSTDSVVYMSHITSGALGRILRSSTGIYDFVVVPEGVATLPDNDGINEVVACTHNANIAVGGGLNAGGSDGIILLGVA